LLTDEAFIAKILANPAIVQKAVAQHMTSVQNSHPPQVISAAGSGAPPAAPYEKPKNQNDAAKLAGAIYDSNFG
jgi:hypothetical protein